MMRAQRDNNPGSAARGAGATERGGKDPGSAGPGPRFFRPGGGARPRALLGIMLTGALALMLTGGCQEDAGVMPGNLPPVTYLSVLGSELDTLTYRQILHWWGTDRDGRVEAYLIKWGSGWTPPESAVRWTEDPSWIVTTATTDTFALATYGVADSSCTNPDIPCSLRFGRHTFTVRALDNEGAADPVGRTQEFSVKNAPPVLLWSNAFGRPDTSLPAVAFAWHPYDRDGLQSRHSYVYWLTQEGKAAADSFFTADTLVGLGPEAFSASPAEPDPQPGTWTLHVQAIDDSRTRSRVISHTWTVRLPDGDYLVIDNLGDVPGAAMDDLFFRSLMDSVVAGDIHVLDIQADGGFRTGVEVGPFLSLFKGVLWYSGMQNAVNDAAVARNLSLADRDNGLREYLTGDGRLVLCAQNAVGDSAALSRSFQREVLGIRDWYRRSDLTSLDPGYVNGNITLPNDSVIRTLIEGQPDSLLIRSPMINADFLILDPEVAPVFTVAPGYLTTTYPPSEGWVFTPDDQTAAPAALGLLNDRNGRVAVSSLIPSRAGGYQSHRRVMLALLQTVFRD